MTERSPIQSTVDRMCRAIAAGSERARDELREFVLGVIDTYDHTWLLYLGNATSRYVASRPGLFSDPPSLVQFTKRLRWFKFKAKLSGQPAATEDLRGLLRESMSRFGDEYLVELARRIADVMATIHTKKVTS